MDYTLVVSIDAEDPTATPAFFPIDSRALACLEWGDEPVGPLLAGRDFDQLCDVLEATDRESREQIRQMLIDVLQGVEEHRNFEFSLEALWTHDRQPDVHVSRVLVTFIPLGCL